MAVTSIKENTNRLQESLSYLTVGSRVLLGVPILVQPATKFFFQGSRWFKGVLNFYSTLIKMNSGHFLSH